MNEIIKFEDMPLSPEVLRAVADMGFEEATPIQSQCISVIMSGRDVIGQAQTGTGKTAAFGIPLLEKIDPENKKLQAVILCPTRELAIQISEEFRKLLRYRDNIRVIPVYGGQPIDRQILAIKKGVQVIAGTPGRVMDHMERRTLRMDSVKCVVLDEADEMLDMGFREDMEFILEKMPEGRQTLLFSATMPAPILELTRLYQNDPQLIKVVHKILTVPNVEQVYFEVKESLKLEAFCRIIDAESPGLTLTFCNTKKRVDELVELLQGRGYFAEGLHGDLKQPQRDLVMKKFRNKTLEILVATDVAARGLDVDDIELVVNYDMPQDEEYYVHRIGRTGRAGKAGRAYTFAVGREINRLREIMQFTQAKILRKSLPSLNDIEEIKTQQFTEKIKAVIENGGLSKYSALVEKLMAEDHTALDIAAALFKQYLFDPDASENGDELFVTETAARETAAEPKKKGTEKLFISSGKKDKIKPGDIVGAIAGECGLSGHHIGQIEIFDNFTFVDVPKAYVKVILAGMKNKKIKGKKIHVERAKAKA
ncbi:MAG: DEAD/DEAH box helicase [Defluviitaleaceae bacterium]|nr:DEAD/DEAH box helicase [Defluviitaleaceae bacterium]